MSRLFVVRHGNTFGADEPPRRIGARTDLPLVASGRAQAEALGTWFRAEGIRFGRALAGPLRRTVETAELVLGCQARPPAVETAGWLAEIDHGPDEDQPEETVVARIGADALAAWDRNVTPPPGWRVDAASRIAAWRALVEVPPPDDMLLVTSNGAARFALVALGLTPAGGVKLRTGAWGAIDPAGPDLLAWDVRP